jgi:CDP-diglyceride synthetase
MHWNLGNTQRGIVGGWVIALCALLAGALQASDPNWLYVLGAAVAATGPVIGALIDPGSAPPKA